MTGTGQASSGLSAIGPQLLTSFVNSVEHNPFFLLTFIIPVVLIFLTSAVVKVKRKSTRIDGPPTLEQKKEKFIIPRDFFTMESEKVIADDFHHFLDPMEKEFHHLREYDEYFRVLLKRFNKFEAMSHSGRKRKKQRGIDGRKETFNEILNLYNRLRKAKNQIVEFEQEDEGIL